MAIKKATSKKTTNKSVTKTVKPTISKTMQSVLDRIAQIEAIDPAKRTSTQVKSLINAKMKVENKSRSKVYRELFQYASADIADLVRTYLGNMTVTKDTFFDALKDKPFYSIWDGLNACGKLSKGARMAADKVAKQGGKIIAAKKTAKNVLETA